MTYLDALRQHTKVGFRHAGWRPGVLVRWDDRLGWLWQTARTKEHWCSLPGSAFDAAGIMGAPLQLDDRWELA
jgi:hypothetical protein